MINLHSAYIFGKKISAGTVPMGPEIYFENGIFNPTCVPAGFDFNNNVAIYDYDETYGGDTLTFYGGYKPLADAGTIARVQKKCSQGHTETWVLEDGVLRFTHTEKEYGEPYDFGKSGEKLLLPVVGWRPAYRYVNVRYRMLQNNSYYGAGICPWAYDDLLFYPDYGYDSCDPDQMWCTDVTDWTEHSGETRNEDGYLVDSIDLITLDSIPDCTDPSYTFEVIKIWGSNTIPE